MSDTENGLVPRLSIHKLEPGQYEYTVTEQGRELFADAGFESIRDVIVSAIQVTGPIIGYEIAYAGITAGTYPLEYLRINSDEVAERAVDMVAAMRAIGAS